MIHRQTERDGLHHEGLPPLDRCTDLAVLPSRRLLDIAKPALRVAGSDLNVDQTNLAVWVMDAHDAQSSRPAWYRRCASSTTASASSFDACSQTAVSTVLMRPAGAPGTCPKPGDPGSLRDP